MFDAFVLFRVRSRPIQYGRDAKMETVNSGAVGTGISDVS
jgi:hypothetical protein